jgi:3-deoxy-D-manno-octulosonate 8-phosphate phosphatase (KDO 8-P phosphatase)
VHASDRASHRPVIRLLVFDIDGAHERLGVSSTRTAATRSRSSSATSTRSSPHATPGCRWLVTGAATAIIHVIARRRGIDRAYSGTRDKVEALAAVANDHGLTRTRSALSATARNAPALELAGLGLAPCDAHEDALAAADCVLRAPGGRGAVGEAVEIALAAAAET